MTALFLEDPPLFFDKATYESTAFANVFPLMQAAIVGWQAEGATADQIAAAMAAVPSMSGQGTMGDKNMPRWRRPGTPSTRSTRRCSTRSSPACQSARRPERAVHRTGRPAAAGRERHAFFGDHAARLAASAPQIDVVEVHGVGHLIHGSRTHRGEYLSHLRMILDKSAPA